MSMLKNILYDSVVVGVDESPDGETASAIVVTEEGNAIIVWSEGYDGLELLEWFGSYHKSKAIEFAVDHARELREAIAKLESSKQATRA